MRRNFKVALVSLGLLAGAVGCTDFLTGDKLSQNPNLPTSASIQQLFVGVQAGQFAFQEGTVAMMMCEWVQSCNGTNSRFVQQAAQYVFGEASNIGANGGGVSSIGVSWTILNSWFAYNEAIGNGGNPSQAGTPGGGSGGAIYNDGNTMTLTIAGTLIENNDAKEGGGAVFYVSNDRTGTMAIDSSVLRHNPSHGFETAGLPGIFFLGARKPTVTGSTLTK